MNGWSAWPLGLVIDAGAAGVGAAFVPGDLQGLHPARLPGFVAHFLYPSLPITVLIVLAELQALPALRDVAPLFVLPAATLAVACVGLRPRGEGPPG